MTAKAFFAWGFVICQSAPFSLADPGNTLTWARGVAAGTSFAQPNRMIATDDDGGIVLLSDSIFGPWLVKFDEYGETSCVTPTVAAHTAFNRHRMADTSPAVS